MTSPALDRRHFLSNTLAAGAALTVGRAPSASAAGATGPWQIGCYTRPWGAYDFRTALDAVAQAGYKHLGLMTIKGPIEGKPGLVLSITSTLEAADRIGQEVRQRGLEIPSTYVGGFPVDKSLDEGIRGLRHLIDCCAVARSKTLLLGGTGNPKIFDAYYKAVAECCDYAAEKRVGMTIKPHGGLNATSAALRKIIQTVGKKNFTVCYDAGNIAFYSNGALDPVRDAAAVDGLVSCWTIKDYSPTRRSPLPKGHQPSKYTGDVALTPGTGVIDFKAVFARLKQGGFRSGALIVECLAPGELPQLLVEAQRARKFLEDLVRAD
jgi:sugar phosphate isomerase/epimerase